MTTFEDRQLPMLNLMGGFTLMGGGLGSAGGNVGKCSKRQKQATALLSASPGPELTL